MISSRQLSTLFLGCLLTALAGVGCTSQGAKAATPKGSGGGRGGGNAPIIMDEGRGATVKDPDGNIFGIHEADANAK